MKKFLLAGVLMLGVETLAFSQKNLVPNGSFENTAATPKNVAQFFLAQPWSSTAPSPEPADLFHKQSRSLDVAAPHNYMGMQEPRTGEAYAGIAVIRKGKIDYREFMQVYLSEPLRKGELYDAEFYVSLSDFSEIATNGLSMYVSHKVPLLAQNGYLMIRPQISKPESEIIAEKQDWVKVSGQFKAQGGETVLTIGNFLSPSKTPKQKVKSARKETDREAFAYYYIDDIKLTRVGDKPEELVAKRSTYFGEIRAKEPIRLSNIFFRPDEAVLLPTSFNELDKLYEFLSENKEMAIQINGHTDITSNPEYNQTLSENRAKAVKTYLIRKGIDERKIKTQGYGDTRPVATNETEEGKQQNRRVEFEVLN
ncbi:OmpA family protein [Adhaeribacter soli]|uniref:OmpA family protein n=1 Tax=Adhaeribacter soli TaxID=2607655 RepID=A0A5N1J565_9BACT|nr:OmpA family protein [Adhaeribacter soli]KAA9345844.1 OmpA family protein [Adhaeribacter soli]